MKVLAEIKKSKVLFVIGIITICLITLVAYANNSNSYGVEIKKDGYNYILQDELITFKKVIMSSNEDSLTYHLEVNNLQTTKQQKEIAIAIDTSNSMTINDKEENVKVKAIDFITNLLGRVPNVKVSLSSNTGVLINLQELTNENLPTYINEISNLVRGEQNNFNDGLEASISSLSSKNSDKYLILFTDATDKVAEKLEKAVNNGINAYSILAKITNSEYLAENANMGKTQMLKDVNFEEIYNQINKSLGNIKIVDNFTTDVQKYFNFEVISENNSEVLKTENGYEWNITEIKSNETKILEFTLTLRDDVIIDASKLNEEIETSTDITLQYTKDAEQTIHEVENATSFIICQYYTLTIKAVSEKSDELVIEDLPVKVVGTIITGQDENGNDIKEVVYENTLRTNSKGEVKIDKLSTIGKITFELKPIVNKVGYKETSATSIIITNEPTQSPLGVSSSELTTKIVNRDISVILPIEVQGFNFNIETQDINNSNIKLGNIEYRLIQPKLNSKYDMEALYGKTDNDGMLTFYPTVMTKAGTYDYVLTQESEQQDYETMGVVIIKITFNNKGEVTKVEKKYNDNVTAKRISNSEAYINVGNRCLQDEIFGIEINVTDKNNKQVVIEGALYTIKVTKEDGSVILLNGNRTNAEGKIELEASGSGNILVEIYEESPKPGYKEDKEIKQLYINRKDGTLKKYIHTVPEGVNAIPDADNNKLIVYLESEIKSEQNKVILQVLDIAEQDIFIPNVVIGLTKVGETEKYLATTDENGMVSYTIAEEVAGNYLYNITLESEVPEGYIVNNNELGVISIGFNDNNLIYDVSEAGTGETNIIYTEPKIEVLEEFTYYTAFAKIAFEADEANNYNIKVKLVDEDNLSSPILGAKYDITVISGNIVRKVVGRATDEKGMLSTKLIGKENVTITITQVESTIGYAINQKSQIIQLVKENGIYKIANQTPYTYDPTSGNNIGGEIVNKDVIYHDVNKKKTGNNAILNLYINKYDKDDNLVGNVKTIITSSTIMNPEGNLLNYNYTLSDENGYVLYNGNEMIGLQIPKLDMPEKTEREDIIKMYEVDENGNIKENTRIELKLTFRYNDNKHIIEVTNVEATWGNRLIKTKTFNGYETSKAYESNVYLDIYTNYDDIGNFSLDFNKLNNEGSELLGATYDVSVIRPDGTRLIRKDLQITNGVEFSGFMVSAGTKIEITEKTAPIGYEVNNYTEILNITDIDKNTGEVSVELENPNYEEPRIQIKDIQKILLDDGTLKTNINVDLIDYELSTFKFGIEAKDSKADTSVSGYSFKIATSQGAQIQTEQTDEKGYVRSLIGANYAKDGFEVTYKIDSYKVANYYKQMSTPIEVKIIFNEFGQVDSERTLGAQTDDGYRTTWDIKQVNTPDGNDIDIVILLDTQDTLKVNIETLNIVDETQVNDVVYKITPSYNIEAIGSSNVEVGYVQPNSVQTYTLQTSSESTKEYAPIKTEQFKIAYDKDGNIQLEGTESLSDYIEIISATEKTINIRVKVLPTYTLNIESVDSITGNQISNIEYRIVSNNIESVGTEEIKVGYVQPNQENVIYTINQNNGSNINDYETMQEKQFSLSYDENGKIILDSAVSKDSFIEIKQVEDNKITLIVKLLPVLIVNVETIDSITSQLITSVEYNVQPSKEIEGVGSEQIKVGYVQPNQEDVIYTIKQINEENIRDYKTMQEKQFSLSYDENGKIILDSAVSKDSFIEIKEVQNNTITIIVKLLPTLIVNIQTVDSINNQVIDGAEYEIKPSEKIEAIGSERIKVGYVQPNQENVIYTIKQINEENTNEYKTVEERQFSLSYDENGKIILSSPVSIDSYIEIKEVQDNTITVIVKLLPALIVNIEAVDSINNEKISNIQYKIEPSEKIAGVGSEQIKVGYVQPNQENMTYTVKQINGDNIVEYRTMEERQFSLSYDENGKIVLDSAVSKDNLVEIKEVQDNTINIVVKLLPALIVNVQTVDSINNQVITGAKYKIEPSEKLEGVGNEQIKAGHVERNTTDKEYTIEQTEIPTQYTNNYVAIKKQKFNISYDDNGNITNASSETSGIEVISTIQNQISIKIKMEPALPIVITSTSYFENKPLLNSNFKITLEESKEIVTNIEGVGYNYLGELGKSSDVTYTIEQTKASVGYAKIEAFQVKVSYDENRTITNVQILGETNKYVEFVTGTYIVPSTTENIGYNGNDKGILMLYIKNYPDVEFQIENVDRINDTKKLAGAVYSVESSIATSDSPIVTNEQGLAIAHLDKSGYSQTVEYIIKELSPAVTYQSLAIDAKIEVDFNNLGKIENVRVIKREDVIIAQKVADAGVERDGFTVNLKVKSNPELKIEISKLDQEDLTPISDVDFEITARVNKNDLVEYNEEDIKCLSIETSEITDEQYKNQVIERLKLTKEDIELIKQQVAYETIVNTLKEENKLTDEEYENIETLVDILEKFNKLVELGKTSTSEVNTYIRNITNQNIIDKLIEEGKLTTDRFNELYNLVRNLIRLDVDNITTDVNGKAIVKLDKTLANKTIEYTIKETRKKQGYDWPDELIIFNVTYDSTGKMIPNEIKKISGNMQIVSTNENEFKIITNIMNEQSKELKIHLNVEDVYDSNKKLETAGFSAFLVDSDTIKVGGSYSSDGKYETTLSSGTPMLIDGTYVHAYGEDLQTMGIYEEKAGTRLLRLVQTTVPDKYYIGGEEHSSNYQSITYALLIKLEFDDEGRIIDSNIYNSGENSGAIGYIADNRYIEISQSGNTLNITIKYYPMLQIQMQAVDKYTNDNLKSNYSITTNNWTPHATAQADVIRSGYIGNLNTSSITINGIVKHDSYYGKVYSKSFETVDGVGNNKIQAFAPTEAEDIDTRERILYIYETSEPTNPLQYQKYVPRYITTRDQRILATIKIYYNEIGEISNVETLKANSSNNIKEDFIEISIEENILKIKVKYAPITTINATTVDAVTGNSLSGIRIVPNQISYEYRTIGYYTTDSRGKTNWTYWGANEAQGQNTYNLTTSFTSSNYNGYFLTGEVTLDVNYDENGRISSANVTSVDEFGEPNAEIVKMENNNLEIRILFNRKFNIRVNKVDYYDTTKALTSTFDVTSQKGLNTKVTSQQLTTLGKIYPSQTVKYTFAESIIPTGYIKPENIEVEVKFAKDGTIEEATSSSEYYELIGFETEATDINRINQTDLEFKIKNKARFDINLSVSDLFYPELKLEGANFTIQNSKGDYANGSVTTDANGQINTYVGSIYSGETVTYTVTQTNTVKGYYENTEIMKFDVKFDTTGNIESYYILSGENSMKIDSTKYINTRKVKLEITNMPKDIKSAIYKYDEITKKPIEGIKFKVTSDISDDEQIIITNSEGKSLNTIDNFMISNDYRKVTYTFSEIEVPHSYRKIQDVVITVTYNPNGSIYLYDVISNKSNVIVKVATKEQIKTNDEKAAHISLNIPNDNAYDLIIKNEDKNYAKLGIIGTTYDVTINGNKQTVTTDQNGTATIEKQTQVGNIDVRIAERDVPNGYRKDNNNDTTLNIIKGDNVYSLEVTKNSNPSYAEVEVDEEHGTITVTFKNESKLELMLQKEDYNTGTLLKDVEFEIIQQEIDNNGNKIGNITTITTNDNNITNEEGLLYFDLGVSNQNKIIEYTFKETVAPVGEDYGLLPEIKVIVTFDIYGNIVGVQDDSFRADTLVEGRSIKVIIKNGSVNPEYTLKVVSEDSQTRGRIDGSMFQIEVLNNGGETIKSVTGTTRQEYKQIGGTQSVIEKGVFKVEKLATQDEITININQIETVVGYVYGNHKTHGTIKANADFKVDSTNMEKSLELSIIEDGGFEIVVDNTNREIIVKIKNDPQLSIDITKIESVGEEEITIQGVKFNITSVIESSTGSIDTGLNETSKLTNTEGHTELNAGVPYAGKTVIYTLTEEKVESYEKLEDIILLIQYDTKGNIYYYELLSDIDDVEIVEEGIFIEKRILSESSVPGIIDVSYTTIQVPTGIGTKMLQLKIKNVKEIPDNPYQIIIEKHHESDPDYPYFISGVTYEIQVNQEYGEKNIQWTDITNKDGIIISKDFDGYGYITIQIKEISAPDEYKIDNTTKTIKVYRNEKTKQLNLISSDIGYEFSDDNTKIYLKPVNEVASGIYSMVINKVDNNNVLINNNPAEFEITMYEENEVLKEIINEETGEISYETEKVQIGTVIAKEQTDETGIIVLDKLPIPKTEGTYTYKIKETKAPKGYKILENEVQLEVTFAKNEEQDIIIQNARIVGENANISKVSEQFLGILISNNKENGDINVNSKPYTLVLNKLDADTKENIEERANFDITLVNGEVIHAATNSDGQIIIENVYMPAVEGQYEIIIKEITAPDGYVLDSEPKTIKITFTGNKNEMVITNIELCDNCENIEVVDEQCTEDKVVLNMINIKGEEDLYVISKLDETNEYIYDVLESFEGRHYELEKPFIDTKTSKYGSNMLVQEFINNLESNGELQILDENGKQMSLSDRVKTNMILKATKGKQELQYTIIVKGDCDGDGRVRTKDLNQLIQHISGQNEISKGIQLRALDFNSDGTIRTTDLNEFYNIIAISE